MPRLSFASVDETSPDIGDHDATKAFYSRNLYAVSATDFRDLAKLQYVPAESRKHQGSEHDLLTPPPSPVGHVTTPRSDSTSDSEDSLEPSLSLINSSCDGSNGETPEPGVYPLQLSSKGGRKVPSITADGVCDDADPFPFPLNPTPLSAHTSTAVATDETLPSTPSRRWPSSGYYLTPPSTPDRYISNRNRPQEASKTFRLSKSPQQLSSSEKLLRHPSATPDPFGPLNVSRTRYHRTTISAPGGAQRRSRSHTIGFTNVLAIPRDSLALQNRQVSPGTIWNVGGSAAAAHSGPIRSVSDGRGGFLSSGSNAPMYTSHFFDEDTIDHGVERMESRLAAALEIDLTSRVIDTSRPLRTAGSVSINSPGSKRKTPHTETRTRWEHSEWNQGGSPSLLDAPSLRDDYYCTILAYCHTAHVLAVGLGNRVYLWSESGGVQYPPEHTTTGDITYVTSVSFSASEGGHSILAIGRNSGQVSLWSLYDVENIRFLRKLPRAVACVAFKPVTTRRHSEHFRCVMATEELLVGDEVGTVYYYSVEWTSKQQLDIHQYEGSMTLLAKIMVHTQQICGLAWSPDGEFFATGGNDNACCLFETRNLLTPGDSTQTVASTYRSQLQTLLGGLGLHNFVTSTHNPFNSIELTVNGAPVNTSSIVSRQESSQIIGDGSQKHKWMHSAAIKAIAFCPWQRGLVATGGGSNDRAIHFYHTYSGACLATIDVHTQVTSLIWSTTRREIAATFGYAQPDHPYRIAVFSWPDCRQVVAIPWGSEMRALYAISYPGGPGETTTNTSMGETWFSRTKEEGCIVVACSDESVKFHEVWSGTKKSTGSHMGLLGGSDILEALEGIDKEGTKTIR